MDSRKSVVAANSAAVACVEKLQPRPTLKLPNHRYALTMQRQSLEEKLLRYKQSLQNAAALTASASKKSILLLDSAAGLTQRKTLVPNEVKERAHLTTEDESDVNPIFLREYVSLSNLDEAQTAISILMKPNKSKDEVQFMTKLLNNLEIWKGKLNLEQQSTSFSATILSHLKLLRTRKGSPVFHYGDVGTVYYIVASGSFSCLIPKKIISKVADDNKPEQLPFQLQYEQNAIDEEKYIHRQFPGFVKVRTYSPGESFGEIALLTLQKERQATIFAREDGCLITLDKSKFDKILALFKELKIRGELEFMHSFSFLHELGPSKIMSLLHSATIVTYSRAHCVYKEGDPCESMFLLRSGQVILSRARNQEAGESILRTGASYSNNSTQLSSNSNSPNLDSYESDSILLDTLSLQRNRSDSRKHHQKKSQIHTAERIAIVSFKENSFFGDEELLNDMKTRITRAEVTSASAEIFILSKQKLFEFLKSSNLLEMLRKEQQIKTAWRNTQFNCIVNTKRVTQSTPPASSSQSSSAASSCMNSYFALHTNSLFNSANPPTEIPDEAAPISSANNQGISNSNNVSIRILNNPITLPKSYISETPAFFTFNSTPISKRKKLAQLANASLSNRPAVPLLSFSQSASPFVTDTATATLMLERQDSCRSKLSNSPEQQSSQQTSYFLGTPRSRNLSQTISPDNQHAPTENLEGKAVVATTTRNDSCMLSLDEVVDFSENNQQKDDLQQHMKQANHATAISINSRSSTPLKDLRGDFKKKFLASFIGKTIDASSKQFLLCRNLPASANGATSSDGIANHSNSSFSRTIATPSVFLSRQPSPSPNKSKQGFQDSQMPNSSAMMTSSISIGGRGMSPPSSTTHMLMTTSSNFRKLHKQPMKSARGASNAILGNAVASTAATAFQTPASFLFDCYEFSPMKVSEENIQATQNSASIRTPHLIYSPRGTPRNFRTLNPTAAIVSPRGITSAAALNFSPRIHFQQQSQQQQTMKQQQQLNNNKLHVKLQSQQQQQASDVTPFCQYSSIFSYNSSGNATAAVANITSSPKQQQQSQLLSLKFSALGQQIELPASQILESPNQKQQCETITSRISSGLRVIVQSQSPNQNNRNNCQSINNLAVKSITLETKRNAHSHQQKSNNIQNLKQQSEYVYQSQRHLTMKSKSSSNPGSLLDSQVVVPSQSMKVISKPRTSSQTNRNTNWCNTGNASHSKLVQSPSEQQLNQNA